MLGPSSTIGDLAESELIARIQSRLPMAPPWINVGIGDDAAVVEPMRNRLEVLTVDALVEGIHFDRTFTPPRAIGHRALAVNLSDLAAMGAQPRLALLSLALPSALICGDFDQMIEGLCDLAVRHRVHVVGGNLTRSPGPLILDITVAGTVKRRRALTRRGARPGDFVYVTGSLGAAAAGLQMLRADAASLSGPTGVRAASNQGPSGITGGSDRGQSAVAAGSDRAPSTVAAGSDRGRSAAAAGSDRAPSTVAAGSDRAPSTVAAGSDRGQSTVAAASEQGQSVPVDRYLYPEPRVRAGMMLSRNRAASACIDLSDGLADAARQVAAASRVGLAIDVDALPIDDDARAWFDARGVDPIAAAVAGGDDYELLFTARPQWARRLHAALQHSGVSITKIGRCTDETAVALVRGSVMTPMPHGYKHFA